MKLALIISVACGVVAWAGLVVQGMGTIALAPWSWWLGFRVLHVRISRPESVLRLPDVLSDTGREHVFRVIQPDRVFFRPRTRTIVPLTAIGRVTVALDRFDIDVRIPAFSALFVVAFCAGLPLAVWASSVGTGGLLGAGTLAALLAVVALAGGSSERRRAWRCAEDVCRAVSHGIAGDPVGVHTSERLGPIHAGRTGRRRQE